MCNRIHDMQESRVTRHILLSVAVLFIKMATPYERGCVSDCHKDWFHGELTRDETADALKQSGGDCFLVRESKRKRSLVLSLSHDGEICHIKIIHGARWYKLEGGEESFSELQELVSHHCDNPVTIGGKSKGTLRVACTKASQLSTTNPG